jgi:6-phosphofructo-2-kinase/fructose-2,6-biphosphatase 4
LGGADEVPADYFKPGAKSKETEALRARILEEFDQKVVDFFFKEGGQVIMYDANNGTLKRRADIREKFGKMGVHVMFLGGCSLQEIALPYLTSHPTCMQRASVQTRR